MEQVLKKNVRNESGSNPTCANATQYLHFIIAQYTISTQYLHNIYTISTEYLLQPGGHLDHAEPVPDALVPPEQHPAVPGVGEGDGEVALLGQQAHLLHLHQLELVTDRK